VPKFKKYQDLAQELALRMHDVLKAAKPRPIQETLLRAAGPKPEGFIIHDIGVYPADEADEAETSGTVVPETRNLPEDGSIAQASDLPPDAAAPETKDDGGSYPPAPPGTAPSAPLFPLMAAVSGADLAGVLGIDAVAPQPAKSNPARSAPAGTVPVKLPVPVFKK
jgi:hypothetical protein